MICIDLETTGLDSQKNSIVSLGALSFFDPMNTFYEECRIWDGSEIDEKALEINGFSLADITDPKKQSPEELLKKFFGWAENLGLRILAGHNVHFDVDFLKSHSERYSLKYPFSYRTIDLHSVFCSKIMKNGGRVSSLGFSLDEILKYVGLSSEPKPHNALMGAKLSSEAFSRIIYGKNLLKEFEEYSLPFYLTF